MKKLTAEEISELTKERPALARWLKDRNAKRVWLLTDEPATVEAGSMGDKNPILAVHVEPNRWDINGERQYIVQSTRRYGKDKDGNKREDKVTAWYADGIMTGRPVKYGPEEKSLARYYKKQGMSIRDIAREMKASTFTIQRLLKE